MFTPLRVKTHYTLLRGLSKPEQVAERCVELGYTSCAITDTASLSGCIEFVKACKKNKIKPILGSEIFLSGKSATIHDDTNRALSTILILAKNKAGWHDLINLSSATNKNEYFYQKPRISRKELGEYVKGNFIGILGIANSELANCIFKDAQVVYKTKTYQDIKEFVHPDWVERCSKLIAEYIEIFGKDNFFLEVNHDGIPIQNDINKAIRYLSKKLNVPCVANTNSYYTKQEEVDDQRILLCTAMETTLKNLQHKIDLKDEPLLGNFLRSRNYHLEGIESLNYLESELDNNKLVDSLCEDYDIFSKPIFPKFPCESEKDLLVKLCREGWKKRIANKVGAKKLPIYEERVKQELDVFNNSGLAGYMLIVNDYVNEFRSRGNIVVARGSGAGSLVLYLLGISNSDPIKYDLMFERFYNEGRNTAERVSLPDVDCDFPSRAREEVKPYLKNKYGEHNVAQICTFSTMKASGALKDVLRAHEACSFDEMNDITKCMPEEAKIADKLQEMQEEEGESGILLWALQNNKKELSEWVQLKDDGTLEGRFAHYFSQAIRLEGTKRSQSRHAAGIVISPLDLRDIVPMVKVSGEDELVTGFAMGPLEDIGIVKFDCLTINAFDKLRGIQNLLSKGEIS